MLAVTGSNVYVSTHLLKSDVLGQKNKHKKGWLLSNMTQFILFSCRLLSNMTQYNLFSRLHSGAKGTDKAGYCQT